VPSFLATTGFDAGSAPEAVAVGDLNGDGIPDLAVADYGGTVSVLLGTGDGSFQAPRIFAAGQIPMGVAVGDFNGDGIPDLAVADNGFRGSGAGVSVLLGNGDGSFQAPTTYITGSSAYAVAVGDFNGGGRLDLAVTDENLAGRVSVLLGNGDGTFQAARNFPTAFTPVPIAVGDFNGDGIPDLAVAGGGAVGVLLGNGDGTFQAPMNYPAGGESSVAVADFNGDGISDLAVGNVSNNTVSVLLGTGDGSFRAAQFYAAGSGPTGVAVGDFNGDGVPDLAVADTTGGVSVLLGTGDGSFRAPRAFTAGSRPTSVAVGDFNGDGTADLAVGDYYGGVSVLLGTGDGSFPTTPSYPAGSIPTSVAAGDFTGDGLLDLAVADYGANEVSVLLGTGDGSFQAPRTFAAGVHPQAVAVGDFNGDGIPDLAVANQGTYPFYTDSSVSVLLGTGDGTFQAARSFAAGIRPYSVAVADFNGDGLPDLAVADYGDSFGDYYGVSVLLGTGDGTFQAARSFAAGLVGPLRSVAAADFNGDGHLDLAVANYGNASISVLLGNGDGSFQAARTFAAGIHPQAVAVGDFNDDGRVDLAVANNDQYLGGVSVLLGNGDGSFQAPRQFAAGSNPNSVTVGDFNGDGIPDLAVTNSGFVRVLLGNGDGSFQTTPASYAAGNVPLSVAVADLNGDGRPDLAVGNWQSNDVSILLNDGVWGGGGAPGAPRSRGSLTRPRTPGIMPDPVRPLPGTTGPLDGGQPPLRPEADPATTGATAAEPIGTPMPAPPVVGAELGAPARPLLDRLFAELQGGWLWDRSPAESGWSDL
jgi:hypothetical protein